MWNIAKLANRAVIGLTGEETLPFLQDLLTCEVETLKPGGVLMLHGYRPEQLAYGTGGPRAEENLYTEALLRESFAELEILALESYDREIDEGVGHSGMSALIDLVARKPG